MSACSSRSWTESAYTTALVPNKEFCRIEIFTHREDALGTPLQSEPMTYGFEGWVPETSQDRLLWPADCGLGMDEELSGTLLPGLGNSIPQRSDVSK